MRPVLCRPLPKRTVLKPSAVVRIGPGLLHLRRDTCHCRPPAIYFAGCRGLALLSDVPALGNHMGLLLLLKRMKEIFS